MRRWVRSLIISCGWLEDFANELGMINEDDMLPAELVVRDAAIVAARCSRRAGISYDGLKERRRRSKGRSIGRPDGGDRLHALDDGPLLRDLLSRENVPAAAMSFRCAVLIEAHLHYG